MRALTVLATLPRRGVALLLGGAALLSLGGGAGLTWALWSDALASPSLQIATSPKVGLTLARVGSSTPSTATAPAAMALQLTVADGQTLLGTAAKSIAIPYSLKMRADGHLGITYTIALPAAASGTLFAASTVRVFPLSSTSDAAAQTDCTVGAAPTTQPPTTDVVGIAAGVHDSTAPNGLATKYWCLTAVYSGSGGTYTNTGSAQGTAASGLTASGSATWTTTVIAPVSYSLTPTIRYPGGS